MSGKRISREKLTIKKMIDSLSSEMPAGVSRAGALRGVVCLRAKAAG